MKDQQRTSFTTHLFKNLSLIYLSILFIPATTTVVTLCLLYGCLFPSPAPVTASTPQKTVLVSSLAMTKGLSLARSFYLAGHRVIGLDFRRAGIPSSGKYSKALSGHYELREPTSAAEREEYVRSLVKIIKEEGVDLWVCVSGVATTTEDAIAKREIGRETSCEVFQFKPKTCKTLHDKYRFIEKTAKIGLQTPETKMVKSHEEAVGFLEGKGEEGSRRYVLKSIWLSDVSRADMTLYPRPTPEETRAMISRLEITAERPWVFQEFVEGEEYCTHAVVVKGRVAAFVGCPSSELLMHYRALPAESKHSKKMLEFTELYAKGLEGGQVTGQLSFDMIVKESNGELQLYPIECNPRTHTAVLLFNKDAKRLAECYLSLLDPPRTPEQDVCIPDTAVADSIYWIGHDIVSLFLLPLFRISDLSGLLAASKEFVIHLLFWKDGTFEIWDPLPFWFLYHVYWPGLFARSLVTGKKWSRINVSTTRVFECN